MKSLNGIAKAALLSFGFLFCTSSLHAGDILTDSLALVSLYDSTDGDNWTDNTGWKTDDLETWFGISLYQGRVSEIYLPKNNLNGNIPPAIGDLDSLVGLQLALNSMLTDSIPPEIGKLKKLQTLFLGSCNLIGNIPPEIGGLTNISQIELLDNSITGAIPAVLGSLGKLQSLHLSYNELSGSIPPELGDLPNLRYLKLNSNNLTDEIPANLGNLSNLTDLDLQYNDLSGSIPPELGILLNLSSLKLSNNSLTGGIPAELGNLSNLNLLYLSYNPLGGPIPSELGNLSILRFLEAFHCQLIDHIPVELAKLSELRVLNIYDNELTGEIPPEFGNLTHLNQLSLSSNNLTGTIPPELGNLSEMVYFELYGNELTGSIPSELGNLTNLMNLIVSENQLIGSLPPSLGNLSNLQRLFVQNNELSGPVPIELTTITTLRRIHIRNNNLEDLPDFSGLEFIDQFHVENNKFTFGDLEPNIHILNTYSPQDSIATIDTVYYTVEDTVQLEAQTGGLYSHYQWTQNFGDISDNDMFAGSTDSVLIIRNPSSEDEGPYSCTVTNDSVIGLTLYRLPVFLSPTVKVENLPRILLCSGSNVKIDYISAEVNPGNTFTVELSDYWGSFEKPIIMGSLSTTDSVGQITVTIPKTISTGDNYHVRINSSVPPIIGIPGEETLYIVNSELPDPVLTPSADPNLCDGESLFLSADNRGDVEYVWYKDDVVIADAIDFNLLVNETGTFHVEITDYCNIIPLPSNRVDVTVSPLPEVELALDGTLLTATESPDYSYVWYKDGIELELPDTDYQYTATEHGEYWVVVTDENACSATSNSQSVTIVSVIENIFSSLEVFPNPTMGKVYINNPGEFQVDRITLTNILGSVIFDQRYDHNNMKEQLEIDISSQMNGVYVIKVFINEKSYCYKITMTKD